MGWEQGKTWRESRWHRWHGQRLLSLVTLCLFVILSSGPNARAAGHGPLWGLATPVNSQGGWSLDTGFMGGEATRNSTHMAREMIAYGLTRDFQVSLSAPLQQASGMMGMLGMRGLAMMPVTDTIEVMAADRFIHHDLGLGRRREDTAYLAVDAPNGAITRPGTFAAIAHGDVSRALYLWEGAGINAWVSGGTHPGNELFYSLVLGYRPRAWRTEYPRPDLRLLLELVGELQQHGERDGRTVAGSGGHRLMLAPGVLGTYRNWGFSAGVGFPIFQDLNGNTPREHLRYGVDVTLFY